MLVRVMENFQKRLHKCVARQGHNFADIILKNFYNVDFKNKNFFLPFYFKFNLEMWEPITPHPVYICITYVYTRRQSTGVNEGLT